VVFDHIIVVNRIITYNLDMSNTQFCLGGPDRHVKSGNFLTKNTYLKKLPGNVGGNTNTTGHRPYCLIGPGPF